MKNKKLFLFAACLGSIIAFPLISRSVPDGRAMDFFQFWVVGQAVKNDDISDVYSAHDKRKINETYKQISQEPDQRFLYKAVSFRHTLKLAGTPFLYSVFSAFSSGNYVTDYRRFRWISWSCFSISVLLLCFKLRFPLLGWPVALLFSSILFWPFRVDVSSANVNQLQVFQLTCVVFLLNMRPEKWANVAVGILVSLSALFKPTFVYFVVPLILWVFLSRHGSSSIALLLGMLIGAFIGVMFPILVFGPIVSWTSWWQSANEILFEWNYLKIGGLSYLFGRVDLFWYRVVGPLCILSYAFYVGWCIFARGRDRSRDASSQRLFETDLCILSSTVALYLLTGALIHGHYFLLLTPALLFLLRPHLGRAVWMRSSFWVGCISFMLLNSYPILRQWGFDVERDLTGWTFIGTALIFFGGLFELKKIVSTA